MGFDLSMRDRERAIADDVDWSFGDLPVTIHGMARLRTAMRRVLTEAPAADYVHVKKFVFNDGQLVTPSECIRIADYMDDLIALNASEVRERPEFFADWTRYCRESAEYGGFEVW